MDAHSVGGGITISRLCEDDQLQQLHQRLRGLPSYLYLSRQELQLEATAHAYLERYPAGTRAQLAAVPVTGADAEDTAQLQELRGKIKKVIEARGAGTHDLDALLERLAEAQDLQTELRQIDQLWKLSRRTNPITRVCCVCGMWRIFLSPQLLMNWG